MSNPVTRFDPAARAALTRLGFSFDLSDGREVASRVSLCLVEVLPVCPGKAYAVGVVLPDGAHLVAEAQRLVITEPAPCHPCTPEPLSAAVAARKSRPIRAARRR